MDWSAFKPQFDAGMHRFPEHSQARRIYRELAQSVVSKCEVSGDDTPLEDAFDMAANLVCDVRDILNPLAIDAAAGSSDERNSRVAEYNKYVRDYQVQSDQLGVLWRFPDVAMAISGGKSSGHYWPVNAEQIGCVVEQYLDQQIYESATLERILAHSAAYIEVLGLGEALRGRATSSGIFSAMMAASVSDDSRRAVEKRRAVAEWFKNVAWLIFAILVGVAAADDSGRWWIGVIAGFGAYLLFRLLQLISRAFEIYTQVRCQQLWSDMASIAKQLTQDPVSPAFLMARIVDTSAKGAVWPSALPCLIERASGRDSVRWRVG